MKQSKISIREAVKFHGHLGPYLILGILAGELALKKLGGKKYFGISVKVWGANIKPKSCLIDGLQLSTGATYGKGNIQKFGGRQIKILFKDCEKKLNVEMRLKKSLIKKLDSLKSHKGSEELAKVLYNGGIDGAFRIRHL